MVGRACLWLMSVPRSETVAVVGLGYVGLPVALAFARKFPTLGYDVDEARVASLRQSEDNSGGGRKSRSSSVRSGR